MALKRFMATSPERLVGAVAVVLAIYVGLMALTGLQFSRMTTGFIPDQDQGPCY